MRCRCPPENWCGEATCRGCSPTRSSSSCDPARMSARFMPLDLHRLGDDLADGERGFSEEYGSWKTIWQCRRMLRSASPDRCVMSLPSNDRAVGRLLEPHHSPGRRRLAAARLADDPQGPAALEREAHPVDGLDRHLAHPHPHRDVHLEVGHLEDAVARPVGRGDGLGGMRRVGGHAAPPSAPTGSRSPRLSSSRAR